MLRHELLSKPKFEVTPRSIVKRPVECVDAGSAYCPCQLAELGQCIECSLLRGEGECRCHWAGSCIWSHSQWGRGKVRQSCKFPILQQWERHEGAIIVAVRVTPSLAAELRAPGSFVFARGNENPHFDTPIAVVRAYPETQIIILAYRVIGPKTRSLRGSGTELWIRGPYWNGITGRRRITATRGESCLLVSGGIAASVLPNVADSLLRGGNQVTAVLGKPECAFIRGFLPESEMRILEMTFPDEKEALHTLMKEISCQMVFCAGGELLTKMTADISARAGVTALFFGAISRTMCCGEGICGACLDVLGCEPIRVCKTLR